MRITNANSALELHFEPPLGAVVRPLRAQRAGVEQTERNLAGQAPVEAGLYHRRVAIDRRPGNRERRPGALAKASADVGVTSPNTCRQPTRPRAVSGRESVNPTSKRAPSVVTP